MTRMDALKRGRETTPVIGEPSFADVLEAIEGADDLTPSRKRHLATSLRQMAGYLGRPLVTIPARITAIANRVSQLHPERLGVNPKTFANHRANTRAALNWFNRQSPEGGRGAPMAPEYRVLWERIESRYARDMLSPFLRYLSGCGISLHEVRDQDVTDYIAYRKQTSFADIKLGHQRLLVRRWNACADEISGWPQVRLTEPAYAKRFTGPAWEDFPPGLRADIDAYCERLAKRHKRWDGRTARPCAPSTIATRRRELIAAVRAALEAGIALEDLKSLRDLLHPDRVEIIIEFYWKKNGERPSLYTIDLAAKFFSLARALPGFDENHLERLDEIRLCLEEHRSTGLTPKNRELVRRVIQGDAWRKVIRLPKRLMAKARSRRRTQPRKAAVTAQLAVAIRILAITAIRMQNLAEIKLELNLIRPGGPSAPYTLDFPDYDVKNRVALQFELDEQTTALIDDYVNEHRPQLMRGRNHDYLFPGEGQDRKCTKTLSEQISGRLWKTLGLKITPHQFRHAAAALILQANPGNYELVRRVLGHRNIQTTINSYIGLETLQATRQFGKMITAMGEKDDEEDRRDG